MNENSKAQIRRIAKMHEALPTNTLVKLGETHESEVVREAIALLLRTRLVSLGDSRDAWDLALTVSLDTLIESARTLESVPLESEITDANGDTVTIGSLLPEETHEGQVDSWLDILDRLDDAIELHETGEVANALVNGRP
tara:strand:- start:791 stop:1210 length:420 start_codon:yes stop_codon:yes gene_type:complete